MPSTAKSDILKAKGENEKALVPILTPFKKTSVFPFTPAKFNMIVPASSAFVILNFFQYHKKFPSTVRFRLESSVCGK